MLGQVRLVHILVNVSLITTVCRLSLSATRESFSALATRRTVKCEGEVEREVQVPRCSESET